MRIVVLVLARADCNPVRAPVKVVKVAAAKAVALLVNVGHVRLLPCRLISTDRGFHPDGTSPRSHERNSFRSRPLRPPPY